MAVADMASDSRSTNKVPNALPDAMPNHDHPIYQPSNLPLRPSISVPVQLCTSSFPPDFKPTAKFERDFWDFAKWNCDQREKRGLPTDSELLDFQIPPDDQVASAGPMPSPPESSSSDSPFAAFGPAMDFDRDFTNWNKDQKENKRESPGDSELFKMIRFSLHSQALGTLDHQNIGPTGPTSSFNAKLAHWFDKQGYEVFSALEIDYYNQTCGGPAYQDHAGPLSSDPDRQRDGQLSDEFDKAAKLLAEVMGPGPDNEAIILFACFYGPITVRLLLSGCREILTIHTEGKGLYEFIPPHPDNTLDKATAYFRLLSRGLAPTFVNFTDEDGYWLILGNEECYRWTAVMAHLMWAMETRWTIIGTGQYNYKGALLLYGRLTPIELFCLRKGGYPPSLAHFGPKGPLPYSEPSAETKTKSPTPDVSVRSESTPPPPLVCSRILTPGSGVVLIHQTKAQKADDESRREAVIAERIAEQKANAEEKQAWIEERRAKQKADVERKAEAERRHKALPEERRAGHKANAERRQKTSEKRKETAESLLALRKG